MLEMSANPKWRGIRPMKLKVVACNVLFRELSHWAARSPHTIDAVYLPRMLHNDPDDLRIALQKEIDNPGDCKAIALGYALCSNGAAYLDVKSVPVIMPKGHDCITLLLGSKERYSECFNGSPGTYYYTSGWIERAGSRAEKTSIDGEAENERVYKEYVERFGEESAQYLMETLHTWWKNYNRACFIKMDLPQSERFEGPARKQAQSVASEFGWEYEEIQGEHSLIRRLVDGEWDEKDFLIAQPGEQIVPAYNDSVVCTTRHPHPIPPRAKSIL